MRITQLRLQLLLWYQLLQQQYTRGFVCSVVVEVGARVRVRATWCGEVCVCAHEERTRCVSNNIHASREKNFPMFSTSNVPNFRKLLARACIRCVSNNRVRATWCGEVCVYAHEEVCAHMRTRCVSNNIHASRVKNFRKFGTLKIMCQTFENCSHVSASGV